MKRWKRCIEIPNFLCPELQSILPDPQFERIPTMGEAFITRWEILSPGKFVFPIAKEAAYNILSVDWGDKSLPNVPYIHTANATIIALEHEYTKPGIYDITVLGTVFETFFITAAQVATFRGIVHGGKLGSLITLLCMKSCKTITVMDNSDWTQSVKIMTNLFAESNFNLPIGSWDVGNVIMMDAIFFKNVKFQQNIMNWNTINVTSLSQAFQLTSYNFPLNWNVSRVENFNNTFSQSKFNQPLSHWNVSSAISMAFMFNVAIYVQPLTFWNVSKVTDFKFMFASSKFNQPLSHWNVSTGKDFNHMFFCNRKFNQPIGNWNVASALNMQLMFFNAAKFKQDLSSWKVDRVVDISSMFFNSLSNIPIWTMPAVTTIDLVNSVNTMPLISATALKNFTSPPGVSSADYEKALKFYAAQTEMKSVNWNVSFASCTIAGMNARTVLKARSWIFSNEGPDWLEHVAI
jgi:hypothetical protein